MKTFLIIFCRVFLIFWFLWIETWLIMKYISVHLILIEDYFFGRRLSFISNFHAVLFILIFPIIQILSHAALLSYIYSFILFVLNDFNLHQCPYNTHCFEYACQTFKTHLFLLLGNIWARDKHDVLIIFFNMK